MAHMIEETDGISFVGERPWHGIGVEVPEYSTARQAMMAAKLNWGVGLVPIYKMGPSGYKEVPKLQAIERLDTGDIFGIVTEKRYTPLQNEDAFDIFQQVLDTGEANIESAGSLKGGRIVWALAKVKDGLGTVNGKDNVALYSILSMGHDGKRSIRVGFTPIRVVCWNTLSNSESSAESKLIRILHRGDVKTNVKRIVETMDIARGEFNATLDVYRKLLNTSVNPADIEKYIRKVFNFADGPFASTKANNIVSNVVELASSGIGNTAYAGTAWGSYNAVTEFLTHHAAHNKDNRFASLWFGNGATINNRALELAQKMVA